MANDEVFTNIQKQNDVIIGLLARLVWKPGELAAIVSRGKRNPTAYVGVYNSLDGMITGTSLAQRAGVKQQTMSEILQAWEEMGIVVNVGTEKQPRYRRLMRIPTKMKKKGQAQANAE